MKKIFTFIGIVGISLTMSSCWPIEKPDQVTPKPYKEIIYEFYDNVQYFTAELQSCYGVKDLDDPSMGTIYATIKITGKLSTSPRIRFESEKYTEKTYITQYMTSSEVRHEANDFVVELDLNKGETFLLELVFPNVSSSLVKIGRLRVSVLINGYKYYPFTIHQIPYLPRDARLTWN